MGKKCVHDLKGHELKKKRVLVRFHLDERLDENQIIIVNPTKVFNVVMNIKYLIAHDAKVIILCGHLGRPEGFNSKYSLKPIAGKLSEILGVEVKMAKDCIGEEVEKLVDEISDGGVLLLENLRFHKEEEKNDPEFAKKLASLADVFVNEAFGIAARVYASNVGVTKYLKLSVGGFDMQREVEFYSENVNNPNESVVYAIVGGTLPAKAEVIETLIKNGYNLVLGGEMMYTLFKAKGYEVGAHIVEECEIAMAKSIIEMAEAKGVTILIPSDVVIIDRKKFLQVVPADRIPDGSMVVCIGPDTIEAFKEACGTAKTIIWNGPISINSEFDKNGPISILEFDKFSPTDDVISNVLADLSAKGVTTIIGGDDTIAAVENVGVAKRMSHISTGFDAGLEILAGKQLPSVCALDDKYTPIPFEFSKLLAEISGWVANQMSHVSTEFGTGLEILAGEQLHAVLCALDDDYTPILSKCSKLLADMSGWFAAANSADIRTVESNCSTSGNRDILFIEWGVLQLCKSIIQVSEKTDREGAYALQYNLKVMQHPNIVSLQEQYIEKYVCLVFDYLDMDSCTDFEKNPHTIKTFLHQILHGVVYCHSHRVLHRDLKPQNLLI
ncbi:hypothetical protein Q3G72_018399 [Acer saccharum]|nr:hypothetical protein Q3G72_018399 [Acer saccharum]